MGGNTGNIRTSRGPSAVNGVRTLGSTIVSQNGGGAGSVRRMYGYYARFGGRNPIQSIFNINYGQFQNRAEFFIGAVYPGYPLSR